MGVEGGYFPEGCQVGGGVGPVACGEEAGGAYCEVELDAGGQGEVVAGQLNLLVEAYWLLVAGDEVAVGAGGEVKAVAVGAAKGGDAGGSKAPLVRS